MSISARMHAIQIPRHGQDADIYEIVDDAPTPQPAPDEVLIRVRYAALNRLDDWVRIGWPGIGLGLPHIPGSDFSGEIAALGSNVSGWQVGQRVTANNALWCASCDQCATGRTNLCESFGILGESRAGVLSDYVALPARNLIEVPAGYGMREAAAASLTYLTAWHSLISKGGLASEEKLLIVGAGGGVNVAALQIGVLRGAETFVIASSEDKARQARQGGASWVCNRAEEPDWARAVRRAAGGGVDMVVDNVGAATLEQSLGALDKGGRVVVVGGTAGYAASVPLSSLFMRHLSILGSTMGTQAEYRDVMNLVFQDRLRPVIDRVFWPRDYSAAIRRMQANRHFGKILVDLQDWEKSASE